MDFERLKILSETPGAPGREDRVRDLVIERLRTSCDEVSTDSLGNVVGLRRAASTDPAAGNPAAGSPATGSPAAERRRLLISGHMDEIGFLVTHVDDDGFLRFITLGGFDPKTLVAQRVIVHGKEDLLGVLGSKPVHVQTEAERNAAPKIEDFFIDLGLPAARVRELVSIGDVVTRERDLVRIGDRVSGKSLDNRLGVHVLLEALDRIAGLPRSKTYDLHALFSTQEEVGIRGATVATRRIDPHVGIALDTTLAIDVPDAKVHERVTTLGAGVAIKVYDSSVICSPAVVDAFKTLAAEKEIPFQIEILPRGGTDTAAIQRSGSGAAVGCLSIPTRYIHSVTEMCDPRDVDATVDLLVAFVEDADRFSL